MTRDFRYCRGTRSTESWQDRGRKIFEDLSKTESISKSVTGKSGRWENKHRLGLCSIISQAFKHKPSAKRKSKTVGKRIMGEHPTKDLDEKPERERRPMEKDYDCVSDNSEGTEPEEIECNDNNDGSSFKNCNAWWMKEAQPLADVGVMNQIRDAEKKAKAAASSIASMRQQIQSLTKQDELNQEELSELQEKQAAIVEKLAEFEAVTKRIQYLVSIADQGNVSFHSLSTTRFVQEKPVQDNHESKEIFPRVIVPPPSSSQMNKMIICDEDLRDRAILSSHQITTELSQPLMDPKLGWVQRGVGGLIGGVGMVAANVPPGIVHQNYFASNSPVKNDLLGNCSSESIVEHLSGKLDASYRLQEKLVQENADMEGHRYQLEEELLNKDQTMESIQKQLESLRCEMKAINAENIQLKEQLKCCQSSNKNQQNESPGLCKKSLCQEQPICKLDLYRQMGLPLPENAGPGGINHPNPAAAAIPQTMEGLVDSMEEEVRAMQKELAMVQAERRSLDIQRKLLKCATPAGGAAPHLNFPCPKMPVCQKEQRETEMINELEAARAECCKAQPPPPQPCPEPPKPPCVRELESQLRELRTQYNRLQMDYKNKVDEVSLCRSEIDKAKKEAAQALEKQDEADARADDLLARLKIVENEKSRMAGSREQIQDMEQQASLAKQRCTEAMEEVEEMKALVEDQSKQLEEYRNKYITAQEMVEEQRRQMDQMEMNNSRYSAQLNKELQQVKADFQKRLEELSPLPELLKTLQQRLVESQQMRTVAEHSCQELSAQVEELKEKVEILEAKPTSGGTPGAKHEEDNKQELLRLKAVVSRLEEMGAEREREVECRTREAMQLAAQLETLREESARQVSRTKDRCEAVRKGLQGHIADLEVQLAQSRAQCRAAAKDRDEIRMKMEAQVAALTKNFEQAQGWVRCLQSHINFLKPANGVILPAKDNPQCATGFMKGFDQVSPLPPPLEHQPTTNTT